MAIHNTGLDISLSTQHSLDFFQEVYHLRWCQGADKTRQSLTLDLVACKESEKEKRRNTEKSAHGKTKTEGKDCA